MKMSEIDPILEAIENGYKVNVFTKSGGLYDNVTILSATREYLTLEQWHNDEEVSWVAVPWRQITEVIYGKPMKTDGK